MPRRGNRSVARQRVATLVRESRRGRRHPDLSISGTTIYRVAFHRCPYQLRLWYTGEAPEAPPTIFQRLLFERGRELEQRYIEHAADGRHFVDIAELPWDERVSATVDAIQSGVDLIAHPLLAPPAMVNEALGVRYRGEADLLVRLPTSTASRPAYEVVEVKSSRSVREYQQLQSAFYSMLLEQVQGKKPDRAAVVTWQADQGGKGLEPHTTWFPLDHIRERLRELLHNDIPRHARDADAFYHLTSQCGSCPYREHCTHRAEEEMDLSLLPGIRRRHKEALQGAGVSTWFDLALLGHRDIARTARDAHVTSVTVSKLSSQAAAIAMNDVIRLPVAASEALADATGASVAEGTRPARLDFGRSFTGARVYFDLESDPLDGNVYLFGYQVEQVRGPGARRGLLRSGVSDAQQLVDMVEAYLSPWGALGRPVYITGDGPAGERAAFEVFLSDMDALRTKSGVLQVFHYGGFEKQQLRALAERHRDIVNVAPRAKRLISECIDLHAAVKGLCYLPVRSYSLKEVAPTLSRITHGRHGHDWEGPRDLRELGEFLRQLGHSRAEAKDGCAELLRAAKSDSVSGAAVLEPSAASSVYWYRQHLASGHPLWMNLIRAYNADDLLERRSVWNGSDFDRL